MELLDSAGAVCRGPRPKSISHHENPGTLYLWRPRQREFLHVYAFNLAKLEELAAAQGIKPDKTAIADFAEWFDMYWKSHDDEFTTC